MKRTKTIAPLLFLATGIAACTSSGRDGVEGIETEKSVSRLMLGARPAEQVAQCMAKMLGISASQEGNDYLLTVRQAPPAVDVVYRIRPITDPYARFLTQVEQTGSSLDSGPALGECLPAES